MRAAERIGLWVLTNLKLDDEPETALVDEVIARLGASSVPEALETIAGSMGEGGDLQ